MYIPIQVLLKYQDYIQIIFQFVGFMFINHCQRRGGGGGGEVWLWHIYSGMAARTSLGHK